MNKPARAAVLEARQSMLRVWMAISAIWVTFWIVMAALVVEALDPHNILIIDLSVCAVIAAVPPILLLAFGATVHLILEAIAQRDRRG